MDVQHKLTIPLILLAAVLLAGVVLFVMLFANIQPGAETMGAQNRPSIQEREAILHQLSNSNSSLSPQQKQSQLTQLSSGRTGTYATASAGSNVAPPSSASQDDPNAEEKLMVLHSLSQQ